MVEKLFRQGPYLSSCEAMVTDMKGDEVSLDRTVFFAFSGGQQSDSGTIGGCPVAEARAQGEEISYKLGCVPSFGVGDRVEVKIDIGKRKRIMRLHSAVHIVFFIFSGHSGVKKLIGSNVTQEKARVDFEYGESVAEVLPQVEEEANELISRDLKISTYADEKNPERWWWECADMKCPCGGTHVRTSSEIGKVRLKRKNIGSGKERIEVTLDSP